MHPLEWMDDQASSLRLVFWGFLVGRMMVMGGMSAHHLKEPAEQDVTTTLLYEAPVHREGPTPSARPGNLTAGVQWAL